MPNGDASLKYELAYSVEWPNELAIPRKSFSKEVAS